jgi:hypothetical protein
MLQCRISNPHTRQPRYQHVPDFAPEWIIGVHQNSNDRPTSDLVKLELNRQTISRIDPNFGLLWHITIYEGAETRLAITFNHTICDGLGGKNLVGQLLHYLGGGDPPMTPPPTGLPPSLESSVDVSVPPPEEAQKNDNPCWPNPPFVAPFTREKRVAVIQISAPNVTALKTVGKANGVKTLHPVLHTIVLGALSAASEGTTLKNIKISTPISLRDPSVGHPYTTGNYVGDLGSSYSELSSSFNFWATARAFAAELTDPVNVDKARRAMGALAHFSDPDPMPEPDKTGWQVWVENEMRKESPYAMSFEISNLGMIQEDLPRVKEVVFAQAPSPIWSAIAFNVRHCFHVQSGPSRILSYSYF